MLKILFILKFCILKRFGIFSLKLKPKFKFEILMENFVTLVKLLKTNLQDYLESVETNIRH